METTDEFKKSVEAAHLEFEKEPMDNNYSNLIAGYPSRLRVKKILKELGDIQGKNILDAGCESGYISLELLKKGANVFAIDIVEPALNKFKEKIKDTQYSPTIIKAAIQEIPFENNKFDAVVCSEVLEHAPNTKKCISELMRVTKHGGSLIITFPNEKNRKPLYPIAKLFGINTSVEKDVTLYSLDQNQIIEMLRLEGGSIIKHYSFPWYYHLTYTIITKK